MKSSSLLKYENDWPAQAGKWSPGAGVIIRGKDLFTELNDFSWMKMLLFQTTGRVFSDEYIKLFDYFWMACTSYPDPRIWNNRIAALAGTTRSTPSLALGSALAISEAQVFGGYPGVRIHDFLCRAMGRIEAGSDLLEIIDEELKHRHIYGFGRPVVNGDERIEPFLSQIQELGFGEGKYFKLLLEIEKILFNKKELAMNIAAPMAAVSADQGITTKEFSVIKTASFSAGILACYTDALNNPPLTLFPVRCDAIEYCGTFEEKTWSSI